MNGNETSKTNESFYKADIQASIPAGSSYTEAV